MLADETLLPKGDLKDFGEKERELRKTEFDVRDALEALGHEVTAIGVSNDLSTIRGAIDALKPHVAFNLVEEFDGIGPFRPARRQLSRVAQAALYRLQPARPDARPRQGADRRSSPTTASKSPSSRSSRNGARSRARSGWLSRSSSSR